MKSIAMLSLKDMWTTARKTTGRLKLKETGKCAVILNSQRHAIIEE